MSLPPSVRTVRPRFRPSCRCGSAGSAPTQPAATDGGGTESPTSTVDGDTESSTTTPPGGSTDAGDATDADDGSTNPVPNTPPAVPSDVGSGVAKKGAWESTSVIPQAGYVSVANTVTIRGSFPSETYVWFGGQPGQVVHQNRSQITVRTPLRSEPGVVDVTLQKSNNGVVLTIPGAYAFVAYDGSTGDPDASPGNPGAGSGDSGSGDGSTPGGSIGTNPSDGTGDSSGGSEDGSTNDGGSTDDSSRSDRRARMLVGSPIELSSGLRGGSVTPNLAAGVPVCSTDPCPATRR